MYIHVVISLYQLCKVIPG